MLHSYKHYTSYIINYDTLITLPYSVNRSQESYSNTAQARGLSQLNSVYISSIQQLLYGENMAVPHFYTRAPSFFFCVFQYFIIPIYTTTKTFNISREKMWRIWFLVSVYWVCYWRYIIHLLGTLVPSIGLSYFNATQWAMEPVGCPCNA